MKIIGHHDRTKPDHWANHFTYCPFVLVDGKTVEHVCEADDVAGYVIVQEYENGRPKADKARGIWVTRRIDGTVQIVGTRHPWLNDRSRGGSNQP